MSAGDWNFLAGRLVGDGTIDVIETELPIVIDSIDRTLSTPPTLSGSITNKVARLTNNGRPVFEPWNTVILVEASDQLRAMGIYRKPNFEGNKWALDVIGMSGYPIGMPYDGSRSYVAADPLDIFRDIWDHLQTQQNGNIGVTLDRTTHSPVRVGTAGTSTTGSDGPRLLNWWETTDLGSTIDSYSKETPFDWRERVYWDGDRPHCHIDLGYPTLGARKDHLRFVLGENLATEPTITELDYVNQAWALGAGEGRLRIRGYAGLNDGRVRRVRVVDDSSYSSVAKANSAAAASLAGTRGQLVVDSLEVYNHPNAPLEAIELGDEILLFAETPWQDVEQYVRVVGKAESPTKTDQATLTVIREVQV